MAHRFCLLSSPQKIHLYEKHKHTGIFRHYCPFSFVPKHLKNPTRQTGWKVHDDEEVVTIYYNSNVTTDKKGRHMVKGGQSFT